MAHSNSIKIILGRHGRAEHNFGHIFAGSRYDTGLTKAGIGDANTLARKILLYHYKPERIVSSCMRRSKETAAAIRERIFEEKGIKIPSMELSEFNEVDIGDFAGKTKDQVIEEFPSQAKIFYSRDIKNWSFPNGEKYEDVIVRVRRGFEKLCESSPNSAVVLIAHAMLNRALISYLFPDNSTVCHDISFPHDELFVIDFDERSERWKIKKEF